MWSLPDIFPLAQEGAALQNNATVHCLDVWEHEEWATLIEGAIGGQKLRRREEKEWASWQERQRERDASEMNHDANLVLLLEGFSYTSRAWRDLAESFVSAHSVMSPSADLRLETNDHRVDDIWNEWD